MASKSGMYTAKLMKQSQALDILKTGANVFLTGEPGSGKTYVINQYINYLKAHSISVAVTASTGIAATHIGGTTIHSWSGIGIKRELTKKDLTSLLQKEYLVNRVQKVSVLIIDEISMLGSQTIGIIDKALKALRNSHQPFGGVQVVFVGDFFQLPPVSRNRETQRFAFESPSWEEAEPLVCYLTEQHRQNQTEFADLLKSIRTNDVATKELITFLEQNSAAQIEGNTTRLYSHNQDVDGLNLRRLKSLSGKEVSITMSSKGRRPLIEQLIKGCLSPETLILKKGAQVIFTKNNYEVGFVNGTLGEVVDYIDGMPVVVTREGQRIEVTPMEWSIEEDNKTLATISQVPLRLAWAITVHKSQGMTLDAAIMDLSRTFEYGQGYVALSRVKSLEGLMLLGINDLALQVHPEIRQFDQVLQSQSVQNTLYLQNYTPKELSQKHKDFIRRSGGTFKTKKTTQHKKKKESTYNQTLRLYQQGKSVAEIAAAREFKQETIISHLEKLRAEGELSLSSLDRVCTDTFKKQLPQIHQAFRDTGDTKLGPVFRKLKGKYSYFDLRLARLVLEKSTN